MSVHFATNMWITEESRVLLCSTNWVPYFMSCDCKFYS